MSGRSCGGRRVGQATSAKAPPMRSAAVSISSAVTINGGAMRGLIATYPPLPNSRPRPACRGYEAPACVHPGACRRVHQFERLLRTHALTSPTKSKRAGSLSSRSRNLAPMTAALVTRSCFSMYSTVASAVAIATGLPRRSDSELWSTAAAISWVVTVPPKGAWRCLWRRP